MCTKPTTQRLPSADEHHNTYRTDRLAWSRLRRKGAGGSLRWRITTAFLFVSLVPLVLVGLGAWHVFHRLSLDKTFELHRSIIERHADVIDSYLSQRLNALALVASNYTLKDVLDADRLATLFQNLQSVYPGDFIDLGVVDSDGNHVSYVGPYDLKNRNYRNADWFETLKREGSYVSDVFLGLRNVPHSVIAVLHHDLDTPWILRATINSERLYALVASLRLGESTEVFVLNKKGEYQTPSKNGAVLNTSDVHLPRSPNETVDRRIRRDNAYYLQVSSWINAGRWLLVVQKAEREIVAPVRQAMIYGALVESTALLLVVIAIFFVTSHLTSKIDEANRQRDAIHSDLMHSAKLASLGELATGLAHEINTPLATICAEQTNIGDLFSELQGPSESIDAIRSSVARCIRQITRCSDITGKMLQFGRRENSGLTLEDLSPHVVEAVNLLSKQARQKNIDLSTEFESDIPKVMINATEFEQVLVNLIHNSIHAVDVGGAIFISLKKSGDAVLLTVADNGHGIPKNNLDRIFTPFFTTKPIGQGTGLGLAISYGLVHAWGGEIAVDSQVNRGTSVRVRLPISTSQKRTSSRELSLDERQSEKCDEKPNHAH